MMRPLQVYLDDVDRARLEQWSRAHRWTMTQAVRTAIRALTRPRGQDPLLAASGLVDGLPADLAERFEQYLQETFDASIPSPPRTHRRRSRARLRR
jgi:hypothetical protein